MDRIHINERESVTVADGIDATVLAGSDEMNMQHFVVEPGAKVPAHVHENEQLGYMIQGRMIVNMPDDEIEVGPGDSYFLAANEPHSAENPGDEPAIGIDIFSPPRSVPGWKPEPDKDN